MRHNQPSPRHRKQSITRYLLLFLLAIAAFVAWQLLGPAPAIRVSRHTTYIAAPLRRDGLPDFPRYVLEKHRAGVTPENNAAVLMWQVFGPEEGSRGMTPDEWQVLGRELQFTSVEPVNGYLGKLYSNQRAVAAWMLEQGRLQTTKGKPSEEAIAEVLQMAWPFKTREASELLDVVQNEIGATLSTPWKSEQLPPVAAWLERNESQLDLLVEASKRPRLFSPEASFFTDPDAELMSYWSRDIYWKTSEIGHILPSRAMWRLGEGRHRAAWDNLFAVLCWSRLIGQDTSLIQKLTAPALEDNARSGVLALIEDKDLPPDLAKQVARELASLGPVVQFADAFDEMERIHFIHIVVTAHKAGAGTFLSYFDQQDESATTFLNHVAFDWNIVLTQGNHWYDRISKAFNLPNHEDRVRELTDLDFELQALAAQVRSPGVWLESAINRRRRSETLAAALISQFQLPLLQLLAIEDRADSQLRGLQLAAALAAYRAEHGEYPERLDQLVPEIVPKLPEFHTADPLVYERDGESYTFSSGSEDLIHKRAEPQ